MNEQVPAIRIVHLLGGYCAVDEGAPEVEVGLHGLAPVFRIRRPEYAHLYAVLRSLSLQPIGVEFIYHAGQLQGEIPIEWQTLNAMGGFGLMTCQQQWANIRHDAAGSGNSLVATLAGKIDTYLELLNLRLLHLSGAYHAVLRAHLKGAHISGRITPGMFSNMFMRDVEAAIHAFLGDAASFRDALAEACWSLVLKRAHGSVTKMTGFMKEAKNVDDPLVIEVIKQTEPGGWIKNLTDLRNEIVHVAPVSRAHELSFCEIRSTPIGGSELLTLHYPFTNADWSLRKDVERFVDHSDETAARSALESFKDFSKRSGDALEYCWRTLSQMVDLADAVRVKSGLRADTPRVHPIPDTFRTHRTRTDR